ncbi:FAD-dependent oxidoreductase [Advenella sp. WQ 585]|uniref:FAD-dependent oxidoreductase n=1 Tax=Advenella mandrilli TaxID=2800330 RepID=A0ABS1EF02_9BURK|nr:FAD-dependent oxidoreductase [Advenella mandrilli]MBK1781888.1 FAD-dependent oxidoreductase [Advenella mandrilli]
MSKYDVVVCGGGIVGLSCALALARQRVNVCLLGPRKKPMANLGEQYHPRIYAVSSASQLFLQELGVWNSIPGERIVPVENMEIHGDRDGMVVLDAWQAAQAELAWIMESGEIEQALFQAVQIFGVPWVDDKMHSYSPGQVITEKGKTIQADLFIGADGARSPLRKATGLAHEAKPYGDTGLVLQLTTEKPHLNTAIQWFRPNGILAFLPLPDTRDGHQVSMVWSLRDEQANVLQAMSPEQLAAELPGQLDEITQGRLGKVSVRSPLYGFPLTLEKAKMTAPGIALVGDAAHRVHPLAGQGLNLGLVDARVLCSTLAHKEPFRSFGDLRVLERYQNERAEAILAMRLATDGLHKLFALPSSGPLALLRNAGMDVVQRLPFVKQRLIAAASGL